MAIEIDQSGKVEETAKPTVLAFSNDEVGAVILTAKDKRKLQEVFREIGAPRLFVDYVFAALLVCLLKALRRKKVVIDLEYAGHTEAIESLVNPHLVVEIEWKRIGKSSRAHDVAYKIFNKKLHIARKITAGEIWKIVLKSGEFLSKKEPVGA